MEILADKTDDQVHFVGSRNLFSCGLCGFSVWTEA